MSSFDAYPGLPIWHSRDLVNWQPLGHAITQNVGAIWAPSTNGGTLWLRVTNNRHIVTIHSSSDGKTWTKYPVQMEVSGYHHNVAGKFLALKPALYAAGTGQVEFRNFRYRALD
ncbi:family 43 glycosylhydrolase [Xanthomonas vasicola]|nr:family 43 glycosylhydrolase [Xanthomonas vasicola]